MSVKQLPDVIQFAYTEYGVSVNNKQKTTAKCKTRVTSRDLRHLVSRHVSSRSRTNTSRWHPWILPNGLLKSFMQWIL